MNEYEITIVATQYHSVFVNADSEEEACEKAEQMFCEGLTEVTSEHLDSLVNWSDAED